MSALDRRIRVLEHVASRFHIPEANRDSFLYWAFWNTLSALILRAWGGYTYSATDLELNLLGYMSAMKGLEENKLKTGVWRFPSGVEIEIAEDSSDVSALPLVRIDDLPEYMASRLAYFKNAPYLGSQEKRLGKLYSLWEECEHEDPYDILNDRQKDFLKSFDWYPSPVPGEVAS